MKKITLSNSKEILIFDNLLNYETKVSLYNFIRQSLFNLNGGDNHYLENKGDFNLYSQFSKEDLSRMNFLNISEIKHVLNLVDGYNIRQIRVNLATLNDKNRFHCDAHNAKKCLTLIYYPNLQWNIEWGGHTLFANDDLSEIEYCSIYKPGRIILMDGNIPHCILPPTNLAPSYRFSFVIQYEI
jgi:hypothetical protein